MIGLTDRQAMQLTYGWTGYVTDGLTYRHI